MGEMIKKATEFFHAMVRFIMGFIALYLFYLATKIIIRGDSDAAALAGVAIAGGGFCLIFFFLSHFKRFKGFGVEAESWEREMEDAVRIAEKFRTLSMLVAQPSISTMMRMGRYGGSLGRRETTVLVNRFEKILKSADATEEEIIAAKRDYIRYTLFDMALPLKETIAPRLEEKIKPLDAAVNAVPQPITDVGAFNNLVENLRSAKTERDYVLGAIDFERVSSDPHVIENRINKCILIDQIEKSELIDSIKDTLDDLYYLHEYHVLRRPEYWFAGDEAK